MTYKQLLERLKNTPSYQLDDDIVMKVYNNPIDHYYTGLELCLSDGNPEGLKQDQMFIVCQDLMPMNQPSMPLGYSAYDPKTGKTNTRNKTMRDFNQFDSLDAQLPESRLAQMSSLEHYCHPLGCDCDRCVLERDIQRDNEQAFYEDIRREQNIQEGEL